MNARATVTNDKPFVDGSHRSCDPAVTLARVEPLLDRVGITRVANITGLDRVHIPVVAVYRPNARSIAVSQGKGLTLDAARASGVMEAIEVWHAEHCDLTLRQGTIDEMQIRHPVCDVKRLPRSSAGHHAHVDGRHLWAEGVNLFDDARLWCPLAVIDADYRWQPDSPSDGFLRSTNGLASGNHWLEAVCHGLGEVIERDAVSVWRARARRFGIPEGRIDPTSVDDPACRNLLDRYAAASIDVGIWDVTSDVGIPAFFVLIMDQVNADSTVMARPANGKGCHTAKAIALSRALTEAAQTRLTYISGARDDLADEDYDTAAQRENVRQCRALLDAPSPPPAMDFGELPDWRSPDFATDLSRILSALREIGIEQAIAIDLAPDSPEVSVARIVVPGLEGPDEHPACLPGPRALSA